jgi:hypothetical protein
LRFGSTDGGSQTKAVAPAVATPAGTPPQTSAVADADAQRLRSEAEALKRQAEAELARARADADAGRAARQKADSEAAAARIRAQAEADAARIRGDAEAAAARARAEAEAQVAKATRKSDAKSSEAAVAIAAPPQASDKGTRATAAAAGSATRFDGAWNVTILCAPTADGALSYTLRLVTQVKDGFLRGDQGIEGSPGWLRLEGQIQPDGSARLDARGLTGDSKYNIKGVAKGTPLGYHVDARFEGSTGTGRRLELRACDLRFVKQ